MSDSHKTPIFRDWKTLEQEQKFSLLISYWAEFNEFPFPRSNTGRIRRFTRWLKKRHISYTSDRAVSRNTVDLKPFYELLLKSKYSW